MALEISNLSELDTATIDAMFATFSQLMQERHPEVELTRGVFHDLVVYFNSVLNATVKENINRVLASNSLLAISTDPALADATLVDKVLSNYNLTRDTGTAATGEAGIVFNLPLQTAIPAAVVFDAAGIRFRPTQTFTALPPGSTATDDSERVMLPVGDGTYVVHVLLQALAVGTAGNIRRGTKLTPNGLINNTTSTAYAASDFVNGAAPATNEEYVSKLAAGLAAKAIGGRQNLEAAIRGQSAFTAVPHFSILGCGDAEQRRDQHSLFPISGGGKVDIYAQTAQGAQEREHLLTAVYVGPGETGTKWQVIIDRDLAPGFYEVSRIAKPLATTSTGYAVLLDSRQVDLVDLDFQPDIRNYVEGAYTRYQTAVIQFEDTDTPTTGLTPNTSTALYSVTTVGLPLIDSIQDFLSDRDNRSRASDILVKAAVPCFTKISFEIRKDANAVDISTAPIKAAIVAAIKNVGFAGQLHASTIAGAVYPFLTGRAALGAIDMFGRIRRPDGSVGYLRDDTLLRVPEDSGRLVTGRTTAFLVNEADISITTVAAGFTG
jgi:hypothetical protein